MRQIRYTSVFIVFVFLVVSCKDSSTSEAHQKSPESGGSFRIAETTPVASIFPHSLTNQAEGLVALQIHDCLTHLNVKTMEVTPGLAEKWDVSPDGKTITFHLRKGAYFHADKCFDNERGPEITSKDVKYSFELLCTQRPENFNFSSVLKDRVVGANEYYEQSKNSKPGDLKGFKIIDNYTFSVELTHPSAVFLQVMANPAIAILSEKAVTTYGKDCKVGAGPFMYDASSTKENFVLIKNPDYYGVDASGYALPYLDTVIVNVLPSIEDALTMFEQGQVDLINALPSGRVKDVVEKHIKEFESSPPTFILDRKADMLSQYYTFNVTKAPFDNVKVRQAINYAINRDKIVETVLQGQAYGPATHGITPSTFSGYDITKIDGYSFDPEKAKKLLSEAGYPGGIGFPSINVLVNSGSSRNTSVIAEIQKQLKDVLNINTSFESLPNGQKFDLEIHGQGDLFRDGWVADYPSPESFLSLFVGENVPSDPTQISYPNTGRYNNLQFDELFKKGYNSSNKDTCYKYFMQAEQLLIKDAPIIPLWYEGAYRLISNRINGFYASPMRFYDLTTVSVKK